MRSQGGHKSGPTNAGWFAVSRDIFGHSIVGAGQAVKPADPTRGAFTKMEAWLDLIAMAAYRPKTVLNKGVSQEIDIGQLMGAYAYLASRWNWSIEKTRWFLRRLESALMITRHCAEQNNKRRTNQIQLINVCNYGDYQFPQRAELQAEQQPQPQANPKHTPGQPQESNNKTPQQDSPPLSPKGKEILSLREIAKRAFDAWVDLATRCGLPVPREASFNDARANDMLRRMKDHAGDKASGEELLAVWMQALANVERSEFLRGMNDKHFKADLTFLCQRKSFTRLVEGGYGNGAHAAGVSATSLDGVNGKPSANARRRLDAIVGRQS